MTKRQFLGIVSGSFLIASTGGYFLSDKHNITRDNNDKNLIVKTPLLPDEVFILYLSSLAPSGHNTQPWFVKYIAPYHWVIGNDKTKWLPAVDPTQRETILSIGAFVQNLEYAANNLGYNCAFSVVATSNQDTEIIGVRLSKTTAAIKFDIKKIKNRITVRSYYLSEAINKKDLNFLFNNEPDFFHFLPNTSKEFTLINQQTIEANRFQSYHNDAQKELAGWIRFASKDAAQYADGLTIASMELSGIPAWVLRNFYTKQSVMKKAFRDQNIDTVTKQVAMSGGWLLITSKGNDVTTLLETGKRLQRLFLKVRERQIAIHPMTQILEDPAINETLNPSIGITDTVQFILRVGYIKNYPEPMSLRRPVDGFVRM